MILAAPFFVGMIVVGVSASYPGIGVLVTLGAMALFAVGLGWFVLSKAGPSKLIVSASAVTLCEHARARRRIAYSRIEDVDVKTRVLTHKFGRRTAQEEIRLLAFRLRSGKIIEILAPDESAGNQAVQMIRHNLASSLKPRRRRNARAQ
ncbi:MAG: hypothetical protein U0359_40800 [Byssovorax sp.]